MLARGTCITPWDPATGVVGDSGVAQACDDHGEDVSSWPPPPAHSSLLPLRADSKPSRGVLGWRRIKPLHGDGSQGGVQQA